MNCHILMAVLLFTQMNNLKVCQSRNLPETAQTDFLNFSVIQDPLVRQYSKEYNTLCPHTHMCYVKINYNASLFGFSDDLKRILKPCCEYCTCGSECLRTLDCCIDALPRLLSSEEANAVYSNPERCIYTQFRPFHAKKYNGLAYKLVTKCSDVFSDIDVKDNCLKDYSEFDFVADIPEYLPVTDTNTMMSYKNMFCALCNHIPHTTLSFWKVEVECGNYIKPNKNETVQTLSDMEDFIAREERCNIVFRHPYRQPHIGRCSPYIDRCNVTGLWEKYNAELESLCVSYTSRYGAYKNIHCYLCNGFKESSISEICEQPPVNWRPSSFVTLLDFNGLEKTEDGTENPFDDLCAQRQKYDLWSNISDCQPPPPKEETDTNFLDFSVIKDPTVRMLSVEYNLLCPHTFMCNVEIDYNHSLFRYLENGLRETPCCGSCDCGSDCLKTLDCCIDGLPRLLSGEEVKTIHDSSAKCIYTQYRPYHADMYNGIGHILVTKCAHGYANAVIKENCLKPYSEFDFVVDIPGYLPVTDNITMVSYQNMYCALCNHVSRSDLIFWEAGVECNEYLMLDKGEIIQSLSHIEDFIKNDTRCNIIFEIPHDLQYRQPFIRRCKPFIDQCNVTGLWKQYDAELESLCMSYFSNYGEYKNVHCYLCNGFDASSIPEICIDGTPTWRPSSFVTLLDFNNLELTEEEEAQEKPTYEVCTTGQKYDVWADRCRDLVCPDFMLFSNRKCRSLFDKLDEATFDITFRLLPHEDYIDVRIIPTLQDLIEADVSRSISELTTTMAEICNVQVLIKLKETLASRRERYEDTSGKHFKEKVNYLAVRLVIDAVGIQNTSATLEELNSKLYSLEFDVTGGFHCEFVDIDFDLFEEKPGSTSPVDTTGSTTDRTEFSYRNIYYEYRFLEAFNDPTDGLGVLPVIPYTSKPCPKAFRLSKFLFCPLISFSDSEFLVENDGNAIYLKDKGVFVNTTDVLFSSNDSVIALCSNSYFSDENKFSRKYHKSNPYIAEVTVSIVCTSISLISLFVVFLTYCSFKVLRTLPGLNNMALVVSLFFAQLLYLLGGTVEIKDPLLCEVIGLLLHFCLVASFFWMAVCTFHMMTVFVFISNRSAAEKTRVVFIRYAIIATFSAAILVCTNIIVSVTSDSSGFGYGGQPCYITNKQMILYTVAIPLGLIIISNFVMFLYVVIKVSRLPDVKKNTKHERRNIIIFAKLSTLTGLTWILTYVYQWTGIVAFAYLFIIANASQGVFIMFSFIVNKRVYGMLCASYKSSNLYKLTSKTHSTTDGTGSKHHSAVSEPKP